MCKKILISADDYRELKKAPPGTKRNVTIKAHRFPGNFEASAGGGTKPFPCHIYPAHGSGTRGNRMTVTIERR